MKIKKNNKASFQDYSATHIKTQEYLDWINEKKVSQRQLHDYLNEI